MKSVFVGPVQLVKKKKYILLLWPPLQKCFLGLLRSDALTPLSSLWGYIIDNKSHKNGSKGQSCQTGRYNQICLSVNSHKLINPFTSLTC